MKNLRIKNLLSENLIENVSFDTTSSLEWIETNGLGGYASGTLSGANTRRYHGLLVAATLPPVGRVKMLAKLDETVIVNENRYDLSSNQFPEAIHPKGFSYLESFSRELFPVFIFTLPDGTSLRKTIAAVNGRNITLILYEVLEAGSSIDMELIPFMAGCDFHHLMQAGNPINTHVEFSNGTLVARPFPNLPSLSIKADKARFSLEGNWYYHFQLPVERYRGQDFDEDLYAIGKLKVRLEKGERFGIIASTEDVSMDDPWVLFEIEKKRRMELLAGQTSQHPVMQTLTLAADQFVVKRGIEFQTIIAGYHWFSDWGRDTMIALPGICLATGRLTEAADILGTFAKYVNCGMIPNHFPDHGEEPEYNTVDATLWFFIAGYRYLKAAGTFNREEEAQNFVMNSLLPVYKDIMKWHLRGTRYNIREDQDGLLHQGENGQQLTWMDARVGNWVVTPRMGKAVEINALWYNALRIMGEFLRLNGEVDEADSFDKRAAIVKLRFEELFWNQEKNCLFDVVNDLDKDDSIRPNQLFAISLPFVLMEGKKAVSILNTVTDQLYTPIGLRSLASSHPDYKSGYGGDQLARDGAYHQGTVWTWLLGPYVDALMKVMGVKGKSSAKKIIMDFRYHFLEGCIGSVSEIADADAPFTPRGCISQAWSVGELLRVISQYKLMEEKKDKRKSVKQDEAFV